MKRILLYNWDHLDGNVGSGVMVYVRNLAVELSQDVEDYEIFFLNAGLTYTADKMIEIVRRGNTINDNIRCFEVINSPVLAPVTQSVKNIQMYLNDKSLKQIIKKFIVDNSIDVIHFNNIEGLSLSVLSLKAELPKVRFVYSVHNYFPVCSRTNLWKDEKSGKGHNCDKTSYEDCSKCYNQRKYDGTVFMRGTKIKSPIRGLIRRMIDLVPEKYEGDEYQRFEIETIKSLNKYMDVILAVSNRVRDILIEHGVDKEKVWTSYIGTQVANNSLRHSVANSKQTPFKLIYMGFMREDKGFYFFLDALEHLDSKFSKDIEVSVVARHSESNREEIQRLDELKNKFAKIEVINGYTRENQRYLLSDINLGVVPILWEDNLPQVAIEQIAHGVPILVSNLGGAQELCTDADFVFEAGNQEDFLGKLINIIEHREKLDLYWNSVNELTTMNKHMQEIINYYEKHDETISNS